MQRALGELKNLRGVFVPGPNEPPVCFDEPGEVAVLNGQCRILRRLAAPAQLNQCRSMTIAPGGRLYAPQTRSDTVVGGRTFDRTVFPAVAVAAPGADRVRIKYSPDLLVTPPHRPAEVAVDGSAVYLAPLFTDSGKRGPHGRYVLHDVGARLDSEPETLRWLDTPSLLGLHRSDSYLHDSRAKTLEEVFTKFNPRDRRGRTSRLNRDEIHALCEFLRYLRSNEKP